MQNIVYWLSVKIFRDPIKMNERISSWIFLLFQVIVILTMLKFLLRQVVIIFAIKFVL